MEVEQLHVHCTCVGASCACVAGYKVQGTLEGDYGGILNDTVTRLKSYTQNLL